ncbi:hypothetical protein KIPB_010421 [Kipferlia bialata]|uniref:Uncharacterized protein n=1 Tax=Kipferlia bialata TaxID=797122 RepID=A0A9K3D310_9EUKA|nr:hypothetical protein KIPB_010421 [Kipferlia bialata]|eukprot:g10421.t1
MSGSDTGVPASPFDRIKTYKDVQGQILREGQLLVKFLTTNVQKTFWLALVSPKATRCDSAGLVLFANSVTSLKQKEQAVVAVGDPSSLDRCAPEAVVRFKYLVSDVVELADPIPSKTQDMKTSVTFTDPAVEGGETQFILKGKEVKEWTVAIRFCMWFSDTPSIPYCRLGHGYDAVYQCLPTVDADLSVLGRACCASAKERDRSLHMGPKEAFDSRLDAYETHTEGLDVYRELLTEPELVIIAMLLRQLPGVVHIAELVDVGCIGVVGDVSWLQVIDCIEMAGFAGTLISFKPPQSLPGFEIDALADMHFAMSASF